MFLTTILCFVFKNKIVGIPCVVGKLDSVMVKERET